MKLERLEHIKIKATVALFARAWIEMIGLIAGDTSEEIVALFARAWIEISIRIFVKTINSVALFARAWIEIESVKQNYKCQYVALFARAWIEMLMS